MERDTAKRRINKEEAMRRINKCLAMAASNEPHQAAIALRQAKKLMEEFDIDHPELLAMGVTEEWAKSRASSKPPAYEIVLANTVAGMYGCDIIFTNRFSRSAVLHGGYTFIGNGTSAQVASYAFAVLNRQLLKARTDYTATFLKRYRRNKVAAADEFCSGWVYAIARLCPTAALTQEQRAACDAYKAKSFRNTHEVKPASRELTRTGRSLAHGAMGELAGRKARVSPGIESTVPAQLSLM